MSTVPGELSRFKENNIDLFGYRFKELCVNHLSQRIIQSRNKTLCTRKSLEQLEKFQCIIIDTKSQAVCASIQILLFIQRVDKLLGATRNESVNYLI